ncbi:MAG: hypothetical protein IKR48_10430, partial [Kiritimatiellae bacterium]|nr:hypothetical protein [Kiritimatiellia bacterium]
FRLLFQSSLSRGFQNQIAKPPRHGQVTGAPRVTHGHITDGLQTDHGQALTEQPPCHGQSGNETTQSPSTLNRRPAPLDHCAARSSAPRDIPAQSPPRTT